MKLKTEITNRKTLSVFLAGTLVMTELLFLVPNTKTYAENSKTKTLTEVTPAKVAVVPIKPLEKLGEFVVAKLDDMNIITIETNLIFPVTSESSYGIIVKENGNIIKIKKVTSNNAMDSTKTYAKIELSENVKIGSKLTILKDGFNEKEVVIGDVMGSANFEKLFYYEGNDLGNTYSVNKTSFKVWAPTATEISLVSYKNWNDKIGIEFIMKKDEKGTWAFDLEGDQKGTFYTYKVKIGDVLNEVVDPYARSVAANGDKGAIIDLKETNPNTWKISEKPNFINMNDAIIYELHVRDFSIDENSGMVNKGKFLAFTETASKGSDGKPTGVDYIKSLGVTHVQLLPIMDYASVDETSVKPQFSWGYDTKNYNVPEGSYSTDPYNPSARIKELKQAVQSLHNSGLRVIMDVAYNNMYSNANSSLNKLVPGYFLRDSKDAINASESGDTITSEKAMARKFVVDSVMYLAKEYNLDGFRFDLMGQLDVKTMNEIRKKISSIDPSILIIGEESDLPSDIPEDTKATQNNASKMPGITHFNHIIRDSIKGSIFDVEAKGFVNGKVQSEINIKKGIVGGIEYSSDIKTWGKIEPVQSINYAEAHNNNTLWDKLLITNPKDNEATRLKMHRMADAIVLTSQGIPFFQAGQEFLRTKGGNANSYKSPDSVNMLDWTRKSQNTDTVDYFKGLIELRKAHPAFRMTSADMITKNLNFLVAPENVVAYEMNYNANMDTWDNIVVAYNANKEDKIIKLSKKGTWNIVVNGEKAGVKTIKQFKGGSLLVPALSSMVIYHETTNIFTTLPFWLYTMLILCGITSIILFLKDRKKA
jgi:pullulanase